VIAGGHGLLGMFDIAIEVLRDNTHSSRRVIRAYCRLVSPPELLYGMDDAAGGFKALGSPKDTSQIGLADRILEVLSGAEGQWLATRDVIAQLDEPKPSQQSVQRVMQTLAEEGAIERIPPLSAGSVQGQTPYWHAVIATSP
jgi:hypothetical protein